MTFPNTLSKYLHAFANLHRNANKTRGLAPHKPILLLAILHEMDTGGITVNLIPPSPELVAAFRVYWDALVPPTAGWLERMATPFRYLRQDGFWELVQNRQVIVPVSGTEYTLNQLNTLGIAGRFDDDLWQLLQDAATRNVFRQHLLTIYFNGAPLAVTPAQPSNYLQNQAQKLKQQAQAKFVKRVRESSDEEYYVRSRLFPSVIKELYDFSCCVCHLNTHLDKGATLIDGAHIMPFSEFHNNDPRNGLALCKNHHWGWDFGMWSLTNDYRILVSSQLRGAVPYIVANASIRLPNDLTYSPDPAALQWHRKKWGFSP
jgi:putative restriction endonuclease